ncbi:MAG: CPBP family intramembrane metalloprotease [Leptospira sp.]|nr:CPBP family intramembrane metalloprotease [Leptospira sp.]
MPLLLTISVSFVTLQDKLPENFEDMSQAEREPLQQEMIKDLGKQLETNRDGLTKKYFEQATSKSPGLLFWNNILWAIAFLLPAYFILKKIDAKYNDLSDELGFGSIGTGIIAGFSLFCLVGSVSLLMLLIGYKPKGNDFEAMLFKNLKDNTYLLAWSIYSIGIVTGIIEEWFFRGFLLTHYVKNGYGRVGLVITSVIFGALHNSPEGSPVVPIILTGVGFYFGYFYLRTGNIWVSISAHATFNSLGLILAYFFGDKIT